MISFAALNATFNAGLRRNNDAETNKVVPPIAIAHAGPSNTMAARKGMKATELVAVPNPN